MRPRLTKEEAKTILSLVDRRIKELEESDLEMTEIEQEVEGLFRLKWQFTKLLNGHRGATGKHGPQWWKGQEPYRFRGLFVRIYDPYRKL